MSEQTEVSFDTALMMALHADAQKELNELPTPAQLKERIYVIFTNTARDQLVILTTKVNNNYKFLVFHAFLHMHLCESIFTIIYAHPFLYWGARFLSQTLIFHYSLLYHTKYMDSIYSV